MQLIWEVHVTDDSACLSASDDFLKINVFKESFSGM